PRVSRCAPLYGSEGASACLGAGKSSDELEAVTIAVADILGQDGHGASGVGEIEMAEETRCIAGDRRQRLEIEHQRARPVRSELAPWAVSAMDAVGDDAVVKLTRQFGHAVFVDAEVAG